MSDWKEQYHKRVAAIREREEDDKVTDKVSEEGVGIEDEYIPEVPLGNVTMVRTENLNADIWGDMLPPLSDADYARLRAGIKVNGIMYPLIVCGDRVVDGCHRLKAAKELGFAEVPIQQGEFKDGDEIRLFILHFQQEGRNLTPEQSRLLLGQYYNLLKKKQGGDRKSVEAQKNQVPDSGTSSKPKRTADAVAKKRGVSKTKVIAAGVEQDFKERHPEYKGCPQIDALALDKEEKQLRKEQGDEVADALFKDAQIKGRAAGWAHGMIVRETLLAARLLNRGIVETVKDALGAVVKGEAKGMLDAAPAEEEPAVEDEKGEPEDSSVPTEEPQAGDTDAKEITSEPSPVGGKYPMDAEDIAERWKVVVDCLVIQQIQEGGSIEGMPWTDLIQTYRAAYGEEPLTGEQQESLIA